MKVLPTVKQVQPQSEPSRSATRDGSGSPRGQHVSHRATRQTTQRSTGSSSRIEVRGCRQFYKVMNDKNQTPCDPFSDEEIARIDEDMISYLEKTEDSGVGDHYPNLTYELHTIYGIPWEDMRFTNGELELTKNGERIMAARCLYDADISPEFRYRGMRHFIVLKCMEDLKSGRD